MTRTRTRLWAGVSAMLVLSVAGLTGCNSQAGMSASADKPAAEICPSESTTGTIKIAMSSPLLIFAPLTMAIETGAFRDAGLDVQVTRIPLADGVPLVAQGQLDAQITTWSAGHFNVVDAGVEMKWIAPIERAQPVSPGTPMQGYWSRTDVIGSPTEPDYSQLRGKTVSSPSAGTGVGGQILSDALAKGGLTLDDVQLKGVAGSDALVALENGAVDAAWIGSPQDVEAAKLPNLTQIATYAPGVTGSSLIAGRTLLDRPDVAVKMLQVMGDVTEQYLMGDYRQNPESVALLAKATQTSEDVVRQSAPIHWDPTFSMDGVASFLDSLQAFSMQRGDLDYEESISAEEMTDTRFSEALAACAPATQS